MRRRLVSACSAALACTVAPPYPGACPGAPWCGEGAGGDAYLGGDDWDAAIVDWLTREHLAVSGIDPRQPSIAANLKALAEYAKVQLSTHSEVVLRWVAPWLAAARRGLPACTGVRGAAAGGHPGGMLQGGCHQHAVGWCCDGRSLAVWTASGC